jgi:hypothetical protein
MANNGISVYIAAHNRDDAHALFQKCMDMAGTGQHYSDELVWADPPRGCARLDTHLYNPETR